MNDETGIGAAATAPPAEIMPVLITGTYRSGTTLIADMLSHAPHTAVDNNRTAFWRDGFVDAVKTAGRVADERLRRLARGGHVPEGTSLIALAYREVMAEAATRRALRWYIEKTTMAAHNVRLLLETFERARAIVMVRDPRDATCSWQRYHKDARLPPPHPSYAALPFYWSDTLAEYTALSRDGVGDRVLLVRFEDLVGNPVATMEGIARFLQMPAAAADVIAAFEGSNSVLGNSSFEAHDRIAGSAVGRWRENLAPADVAGVELVNRASMIELGYTPHYPLWRLCALLPVTTLRFVAFLITAPRSGPGRIRDGRPTHWVYKRLRLAGTFLRAVGRLAVRGRPVRTEPTSART